MLLRTLAAGVVIAWVVRFRSGGMRLAHALAAGVVVLALVWHEVWSGLLIALALAVSGPRTLGGELRAGARRGLDP